MVPVNYLAILISAVESMVLGFLWYGPLFSTIWAKEMGWTKEKMEKMKSKTSGMGKMYALQA